MRFQLSRVAWGRYYAAKDIKFGVEARVFDVEDLVDAVKVTMGPKRLKFDKPLGVKGHNVVLEHLKLQKTGATVARNIDFKDKVKIVGASLVNQVANASATNDVAGDGSTCARVMTSNIC
ncbi:chaperonin CPN60-2, mitochondrial [Canna indica]|uniref:Chaperonin CPN60-2, mitochondrial n=1 Tax=Canna indica TaxID=4628 RepID=A0AAQ3KHZ9_9LILI|nr:chaperonin CPN60-2, mitochondrial [Canna indica]